MPSRHSRCAADFIALLDDVLRAFPRAPVIVVICDNDSIHHARKVIAYRKEPPGWSCFTAPGTAQAPACSVNLGLSPG